MSLCLPQPLPPHPILTPAALVRRAGDASTRSSQSLLFGDLATQMQRLRSAARGGELEYRQTPEYETEVLIMISARFTYDLGEG